MSSTLSDDLGSLVGSPYTIISLFHNFKGFQSETLTPKRAHQDFLAKLLEGEYVVTHKDIDALHGFLQLLVILLCYRHCEFIYVCVKGTNRNKEKSPREHSTEPYSLRFFTLWVVYHKDNPKDTLRTVYTKVDRHIFGVNNDMIPLGSPENAFFDRHLQERVQCLT